LFQEGVERSLFELRKNNYSKNILVIQASICN